MVAELIESAPVPESPEADKQKRVLPVGPEVIQAVWEAEDGRCEACKRPLSRRCTRMLPVREDLPESEWSVETLHLVCVDCLYRHPDYLAKVEMAPNTVAKLAHKVGEDRAEMLAQLLLKALQQYGVMVTSQKLWRVYWLPGIGHFKVRWGGIGKPSTVSVQNMYPEPNLVVKPQARTRGLPRPDRTPLKKPKVKREKKPKEVPAESQAESTSEETPTPVGVG